MEPSSEINMKNEMKTMKGLHYSVKYTPYSCKRITGIGETAKQFSSGFELYLIPYIFTVIIAAIMLMLRLPSRRPMGFVVLRFVASDTVGAIGARWAQRLIALKV